MIYRINITGVDGVGKTSLINYFRDHPLPGLKVFRAPLYHDSPHCPDSPICPVRSVSLAISELNLLAAKTNNPSLKGLALFLGMTPYRTCEDYFIQLKDTKFLLSERSPVFDALAYLEIYRENLKRLDPEKSPGIWKGIEVGLAPDASRALESWFKILFRVDSAAEAFHQTLVILSDFSRLSPEELMEPLISFYSYNFPDQQILLEASSECIINRLSARQSGLTTMEWHENSSRVIELQKSFRKIFMLLRKKSNQCHFMSYLTDTNSVETLARKITESIHKLEFDPYIIPGPQNHTRI